MTANVLLHKKKTWSEVSHYWQVRALQTLLLHNTEINLDPRYQSLALILAEDQLDEDEVEHMFRTLPKEMSHIQLHIFPNVPSELSKQEIFDIIASELNVTATEINR